MTEDWQTHTIQEYDTHYVAIGNGTTGPPDHIHFIRFTNLDKSGNFISSWTYIISDTVSTEIRSQQSLSCFENNKVMGITGKEYISNDIKTSRIRLNNNLSEVIDWEWQYIPPYPNQQSAIIAVHQVDTHKILHGLNYYDTDDDKIKSVLIVTDSAENTVWESIFPCEGNYCRMLPRHIITTYDGGYLYTNHEHRNYWQISDHIISTIIKVNSLGEQQWRIYPGSVGDPYTSEEILLVPTDDGNYLCAWTDKRILNINTYQTNPDGTIWFAKIDEAGNKLWEKNIQEDIDIWNVDDTKYRLSQMIRLNDGNIALIGEGRIIKLTQNADILWARDVKPSGIESPNSSAAYLSLYGITETSDGGFACTGEANIYPGDAFPEYLQTGFVLKLDEYGCLEEGCHLDDPVVSMEEVIKETNLSIYPNPTSRDITINYTLPSTPDQLTLSIHNIMGKAVHTQPLPVYEGSVRVELDKNLAAGTYFCHLMADGQVVGVERFVLVR